ncbi:very short patch repair endonuclease [Rhizobium johnstonii]|uniref:very short patch repair endonuclease n=1 Tax=Rhizobium johnstonii TaxID=3019933 RepID=UPI003F9CF191
MADVLTTEQRRLNMSRNKGRNTRPEIKLRSALHAAGLRFRIHRRDLPGSPDIVFPAARIAVFVDGCFWHGCPIHGAKPKTNEEFWASKLARNRLRDHEVGLQLSGLGWHVLRIWEHEVRKDLPSVVTTLHEKIRDISEAARLA